MKGKYIGIVAFVLIIVLVVGAMIQMAFPGALNGKAIKMVEYLNEKYGYNVSAYQCIYFRNEDYSFHGGLVGGTTYDIPYIGIFEYEGRYITVADTHGFMGDDNQLDEVSDLLCSHFEETLGISPFRVELWDGMSFNEVLLRKFNERLTPENIGGYMQKILDSEEETRMLLYFHAEEDIDRQIEEITAQFSRFRGNTGLSSIGFYITDMEEPEILEMEASVHWQEDYRNEDESAIGYICRYSMLVNAVEHYYQWGSVVGERIDQEKLYNNTFLKGGSIAFTNRHDIGFGSREVMYSNGFRVVDLSDNALEGYLEEMVSYGEFRGYTILFRAGEGVAEDVLRIQAGDKYLWEFKWDSGPLELYAFRDGWLQELKEVYKCGLMSADDMDLILEEHEEYYEEQHSKE